MEKISPRVDVAFKKIFGVEENKDLLISLINSIVGKEDQVLDITLLNPYNPQNFRQDKLSILDIKAKGIDGKRFNIEIQISDEADYDKRALYYWAKLYTEQLKVAQDYSTLAKAIGIHILNFTSIPEAENYHNVFHITEKENGFAYFKDLELHTIELNKFTCDSSEELQDIVAKTRNALDMWLTFLTRHDLLKADKLPKELDNDKLKKALKVLDVLNFSEEERELYEDHLKWLRIEANTLKKTAEKAKEEGIAEGIEKGIEKRNIEVAINMIKQKLDNKLISSVTGLTLEEILKLKNKN
ncbi:MAG: Rpn family recombination-promoting nuclease/putative transposase [Alphaproteobacteria bacterium]|jgi:predicted transposase/invertase (TIGR01784 family)|nr:Rpn family recombination-promoting nuclease/putative transposase [Alphaproteobacteria bacterium]